MTQISGVSWNPYIPIYGSQNANTTASINAANVNAATGDTAAGDSALDALGGTTGSTGTTASPLQLPTGDLDQFSAELQAMMLQLQSTSTATQTDPSSASASADSATAAATTNVAQSGSTDGTPDAGQISGKHGHHHHHPPPPDAADTPDPSAAISSTSSTSSTDSSSETGATDPLKSLADNFAQDFINALQAYTSTNVGGSAAMTAMQSATSITA